LFACSKNKFPDDVIKPEKMESVFWDFIRADVLTTDYRNDSANIRMRENIKLQKKIFQIHGITREQFYKSYDYYTQHPELMKTMLDSITAKQGRRKFQPDIKETKSL
jgi:hypothetical protein